MKKLFFCSLLSLINICGFSASYYTRVSGGQWHNNIWGTSTTGTGSALPTLVDGDIIYIDDPISITTIISTNADIRIVISATLTIDGQLSVGNGSIFDFTSSSGKIVATPPGNSDKIFIGTGPAEWTGNDGTITGPGTFSDGWPGGALPITMSKFYSEQSATEIMLFWSTIMEKNFSRFIIERSANGKKFLEIGVVAATGNNVENVETKYSFVDADPLVGFNYYRLKAIDFDETFELVQPIVVKHAGLKKLSVHPNPSSGSEVNVSLNFQSQEGGRISIINQYGVEVYNSTGVDTTATLIFNNALSPGMYVVKYSSGDFSGVSRILVK